MISVGIQYLNRIQRVRLRFSSLYEATRFNENGKPHKILAIDGQRTFRPLSHTFGPLYIHKTINIPSFQHTTDARPIETPRNIIRQSRGRSIHHVATTKFHSPILSILDYRLVCSSEKDSTKT